VLGLKEVGEAEGARRPWTAVDGTLACVYEGLEWRERSEPVTERGERGQRKRGVSRASPRMQQLHARVQNWTTTGHVGWKRMIRVLLPGLTQGCFENQLGHNAEAVRATK
jgi:hypothetical protein